MSNFKVGDRVYHKSRGLGEVTKDGLFLDSVFVRFGDGLLYHALDQNLAAAAADYRPKEEYFAVILNGSRYPIAPGGFEDATEAAKEIAASNPGAVVEVYKRITGFTTETAVREVA